MSQRLVHASSCTTANGSLLAAKSVAKSVMKLARLMLSSSVPLKSRGAISGRVLMVKKLRTQKEYSWPSWAKHASIRVGIETPGLVNPP